MTTPATGRRSFPLAVLLAAWLPGCGSVAVEETDPPGGIVPPAPSCVADGGSREVAAPELIAEFSDRWHEAWLGSPVVEDLDDDGVIEIVAARDNLVLAWHLDGTVVLRKETAEGRIWSSPVVADLVPGGGLEIAVASRSEIYVWDHDGNPVDPFPVQWEDELRSLAAGDIDGDGQYELVAVSTDGPDDPNYDRKDLVIAFKMNGDVVDGFPPITSGASGCDEACYTTGGFDQNVALGDVDGDGISDIFATQDNAYLSLHEGNGRAFDAASIFQERLKFQGIRFYLDYEGSQEGWLPDEENVNQAHFTNSAPAIADVDGDGMNELIVLGSVQNAAQTDRYRGVALWVMKSDGSRIENWGEPFYAPDYLAGLWDYEGTNVVAATNQVTVADIDPDRPGPELIFAGFDGRIHAVDAARNQMWYYRYTYDDHVLTGGVAVADLSSDGSPEVVFTSYSPDDDKSHLFVLDSGGNELHKLPLPGRGAMPVPTIADADDDGQIEIIVSLKGGEDGDTQVQVYTVAGSSDSCLLWPTGRGNYLRDGYVRGQ